MIDITPKQIRFLARMGARGALGEAVFQSANVKDDFFVLSADLGHASGFDRFMRDYPDRYVNVGIAEQNLVAVAAGIAKSGSPAIATTYAPFASFRCADQVRNYMGYMGLNVKLVGLDSGMIQSKFGGSHYGTEDISLIRAIPNITLIAPSDGAQIVQAVEAMLDLQGPVYLRITGGALLPSIYSAENARFEIGKANIIRDGKDVAMIATGSILYNVVKAAEQLQEIGINVTVIDMHTIKPLDEECLEKLEVYNYIFTVEEHSVIGGLGSAVAEYFSSKRKKPEQIMLGIKDCFPHPGSYEYLLKTNGLDVESIKNKVIEYVGRDL